MLQTEVTQQLYEIVMGENPSYFKGDGEPPAKGGAGTIPLLLRPLRGKHAGRDSPEDALWHGC